MPYEVLSHNPLLEPDTKRISSKFVGFYLLNKNNHPGEGSAEILVLLLEWAKIMPIATEMVQKTNSTAGISQMPPFVVSRGIS